MKSSIVLHVNEIGRGGVRWGVRRGWWEGRMEGVEGRKDEEGAQSAGGRKGNAKWRKKGVQQDRKKLRVIKKLGYIYREVICGIVKSRA